MVKRSGIVIAASALFIAALAGCGSSGSESSATVIRIAHNSNAGALTARIAQEQGFLKAHGVEAKFTKVENIETLPPALGKSFDVVMSTPTILISGASKGIDLRELAGTSLEVRDNPTAAVLAGPKSGVKEGRDLEGKTIGILNETGTLHTSTKFWLDKIGVPLDSIKIVQIDPPAQKDQLMAGRVDAVETVMPFMSSIQAMPGVVDLGQPHLEMANEIGLILWATSSKWAKDNPEAVSAFRAGLADAVAWVEDPKNEAAARKSLQNYTGLPEGVIAKLPIPTYEAEPRAQDLPIWLDAMKRYAGFEGDVDVNDLIVDAG